MTVHYGRNVAAYDRDDFINAYISMINRKRITFEQINQNGKKWLPAKNADISQVN